MGLPELDILISSSLVNWVLQAYLCLIVTQNYNIIEFFTSCFHIPTTNCQWSQSYYIICTFCYFTIQHTICYFICELVFHANNCLFINKQVKKYQVWKELHDEILTWIHTIPLGNKTSHSRGEGQKFKQRWNSITELIIVALNGKNSQIIIKEEDISKQKMITAVLLCGHVTCQLLKCPCVWKNLIQEPSKNHKCGLPWML